MKTIRILPLLAGLALPCAAAAQATAPVQVEVLNAPALAHAGGAGHLVYELHVSNLADQALSLDTVEVRSADDGAPVRAYAGDLLRHNLHRIGTVPDSAAENVLGAGQRGIVYVWAPVGGGAPPAALAHRVVLSTARGTRISIHTPPVPVDAREPVVLGPPLRGGGWIAGNAPDPDATPGHNRMLVSVGGRVVLPQRFATDWVKLDPDGRIWSGDATRNERWAGWGEDLLAVADGEVVEAVDTLPDQTPPEYRPGPANRLVMHVGGGRYAVYAHLRQGSLRVHTGDVVRRGQVVAQVGNSGNSTGPHLHFQVLNAPSALAGEGVPFVFEQYQVQGVLDLELDAYEAGAAWRPGPRPAVERRRELPVGGQVIRF
jgi:murein DD-endopeptidase